MTAPAEESDCTASTDRHQRGDAPLREKPPTASRLRPQPSPPPVVPAAARNAASTLAPRPSGRETPRLSPLRSKRSRHLARSVALHRRCLRMTGASEIQVYLRGTMTPPLVVNCARPLPGEAHPDRESSV